MEKEKAFKVGSEITYKSIYDCIHSNGTKGNYYHGGINWDGHVGKVLRYDYYNEERGCWRIEVSNRDGSYSMLESEFLEYDIQAKSELFPIY